MKSSQERLLRLIAIFKFLKAALLIALSVGVFKSMHRDIGEIAERWVEALRLNPGNHFVDTALSRISNLTPAQIKKLGLGGLVYAALFLTEGTGLWLLKPWGEWVTVIITGTGVPVEIYEIHRHPTGVKVAALVINVVIVAYLIYHIRTRRKGAGQRIRSVLN
jgi:uncharacterized membrane protein (DUF2068 family)